jgi:putative ABC transport system permease protein
VEHDYTGTDLRVYDTAAMANTQVSSYRGMMSLITLVILVIVAVVGALVVFLVLTVAVLRGRRDLGIQKAVGFTTGQLVRQVTATYLPSVVVGAVAGGAVGHTGFPLFIDTIFRTMNIYTSRMQATAVTTGGVVVGLAVLAVVVAVIVAARVRKISPYLLVVE